MLSCSRVRVSQNSLECLWKLSDPYEKSQHSQDKNVTPINLKMLEGILLIFFTEKGLLIEELQYIINLFI